MKSVGSFFRLLASLALAAAIFLGRLRLVLAAVVPTALARWWDRRRPPPRRPPRGARRRRVLLIGGTINHTTQVEQIAAELTEFDVAFTWYYCDGILDLFRRLGLMENTAVGAKLRARCLAYLKKHHLAIDLDGAAGDYNLCVTCSDLVVPRNVRGAPVVLVQEGIDRSGGSDLPPGEAASAAGLNIHHVVDHGPRPRLDRLCVASEGYRDLFVRKGVAPEKIVVTGIPNFDNCERFLQNDFPLRDYVLVCSSDIRETLRWENRPAFVRQVVAIAAGRTNRLEAAPERERETRPRRAGRARAEGAQVFESGCAEGDDRQLHRPGHPVLVDRLRRPGAGQGGALLLPNVEELRRLCPQQNGRTSARRIANVCRELLGTPIPARAPVRPAPPVPEPPRALATYALDRDSA